MTAHGGLPARARISVVVVSRNEGAELEATLTNLLDTLPASERELIVVDDGSSDGSTEFLNALPEVVLLRTAGIGVARARNHGASRASGDVVLFCDAHVRTPPGWHEPLADLLRRSQVGAVAPGVYSLTEPKRRGFGLELRGHDLHPTWRQKPGPDPRPVPVLPGCFLGMRRQTFLHTGGFDPGMRQVGGNDAEISCRFWLLGYEQWLVPEVEVGHLFRTAAPYQTNWASVVHNRLRMAFVHFGPNRIERVVGALRAYDAFPAAVAMIADSNVNMRRAELSATRRFDDDWFFEKFPLLN